MISIHPPPLSSSSPLPRALHPKARCLDWQAKDFPQWKGGGLPPCGAGWDVGGGPRYVSCTWAQIPPWGFGVYFQEPGFQHYPRTALPSAWRLLLPFRAWGMVSWFLVT